MAKAVILPWLLLIGGMSLWSSGTSQQRYGDVPLHARLTAGRQGWVCNPGFRQLAQFCASDQDGLTDTRVFEVFNNGWRCRSGYHVSRGFCLRLAVPRHALLVGYGDHWECEPGFRRDGSRCQAVLVPAHGHLDESGHGWQCDTGYEAASEYCIPSSLGTLMGEKPS
jgi:hypothetical protein